MYHRSFFDKDNFYQKLFLNTKKSIQMMAKSLKRGGQDYTIRLGMGIQSALNCYLKMVPIVY